MQMFINGTSVLGFNPQNLYDTNKLYNDYNDIGIPDTDRYC